MRDKTASDNFVNIAKEEKSLRNLIVEIIEMGQLNVADEDETSTLISKLNSLLEKMPTCTNLLHKDSNNVYYHQFYKFLVSLIDNGDFTDLNLKALELLHIFSRLKFLKTL